jgi:hypothetical protein
MEQAENFSRLSECQDAQDRLNEQAGSTQVNLVINDKKRYQLEKSI